MNDIDTQVRDTFAAVGGSTPVPVFDEVAFQGKVRRARRRRGAVTAVTSAAAVGVLAVSAYAVNGVLDGGGAGDRARTPQVATAPDQQETLRPSPLLTQPLFYTSGGRLTALTPDGTVHDLGLRSEAVVGFTQEGVLALDDESGLVWFDADSSGERDGRFTFTRGESPVAGPVQSVALSGDRRFLAWIDLEGTVTVRDLKADAVVRTFDAARNSYVAAVSDRGVLVSEDGDLMLNTPEGSIPVPTAQDGYGWQSDVAGDRVAVMDRDGVTRVYDVSGDEAELEVEVPGSGRLAPYGAAVATVHLGGPAVRLWTVDGGLDPLLALDDGQHAESVGWLDEDYAVVTSGSATGTTVHVCEIATRNCDEVLTSEQDVRLSE